MIKLLGFFLILLAIAGFGVTLLWMNLTPGHFQVAECCGEVRYISEVIECETLFKCEYPRGVNAVRNQGLLLLARLDFNP